MDDRCEILAEAWGWRHSGRQAWALRDISLTIKPGERILLAGASGSGKSTLMHALAGVLDPDEGQVEGILQVRGQDPSSPSIRGEVGLVQQDPDSQVVMTKIGDEVAFGLENIAVPRKEIWERVEDSLHAVGLDLPQDHPTTELSGGQKQRLALACSLAMRPQILLLDEPTANLDPDGAKDLREVTKSVITQTRATLIVIEHFIEPWLDQIDRIIVLREGRVIADGPVEQVLKENSDQLRADGLWVPGESTEQLLESANERLQSASTVFESRPIEDSGPQLACQDLAIGYSRDKTPVNSEISLSFSEGQVTSIIGDNGVGKTTLALTLSGLLNPLAGTVTTSDSLRGSKRLLTDPNSWSSEDLLGRISMVFQEPAYQFVTNSVEEELAVGLKVADPGSDHSERIDLYLSALKLDHLRRAHPLSLSGGEKRRLSVATAMISTPRILVLDEPTFGQDRNTWATLVLLLKQVAEQGTMIISVTHDLKFVEAMGGTVIELHSGNPQSKTTEESAPHRTPKPALIDRVNPVIQLIGILLLTLPLIATIDLVSPAVALGAELLLMPVMGMSLRKILSKIWPLLVAAPLTVVSMLLYGAPGGHIYWQLGPAIISDNSVELAIALGMRVLALGIPTVLILSRIDATEMADSLTQVLHLPSRLVLSALAGIRMVTLMMADWHGLERARRSRGIGSEGRFRAFFKNSFALLAFAIRRAGTLSVTMEARGFGSDQPRTHARLSTLCGADVAMILACVGISALAISTAVAVGSFRWFGL